MAINVSGSVTPGKVYTVDAEDKALVTPDNLNLLGNPSVSMSLDEVLMTATATVGDQAANVVTVTVNVKDFLGTALNGRYVFDYWLSDAANGAPTSTIPSGGVNVSTGTELRPLANDETSKVMTDANGDAVLAFTEAGALTRYFNMNLQAKQVAGDAALTWT
jgi:hypothetical protein